MAFLADPRVVQGQLLEGGGSIPFRTRRCAACPGPARPLAWAPAAPVACACLAVSAGDVPADGRCRAALPCIAGPGFKLDSLT